MNTRERRIYRVTLTGSIVNLVLTLMKFAAGILGHSGAMIADAVHSLSDYVTDLAVILLVRLSSRPADADHDYGHGKYETIATSLIGLALIGVAVSLAWNGAVKIIDAVNGRPAPSPGYVALGAALVSIAAKEWIYRATRTVAREVHSAALEANAWHHRSDALSSVATALGIGGAILLGPSWTILDPLAAIVVSILIAASGYQLVASSGAELLEKSLPRETEDRIEAIVLEDPLVSDLHHLHTRRIGPIIAIEMHLRMDGRTPLSEVHAHATATERRLRQEFGKGTHIMLHMEPVK